MIYNRRGILHLANGCLGDRCLDCLMRKKGSFDSLAMALRVCERAFPDLPTYALALSSQTALHAADPDLWQCEGSHYHAFGIV